MNPILFDATETEFVSHGLGVLSDTISCMVTEERNGAFELVLEYPLSGIHYENIQNQNLIYCKPNPYAQPQPFRIYRMTKPLSGKVTVYAQHISYDLSGIPVHPFTAGSAVSALAKMEDGAAVPNHFRFWTDQEKVAAMSVSVPSSIRSLLGDSQGSILDLYGGEYEWDKWTVKLWSERGQDRGVVIRYGKNLTDVEQDENISHLVTGVYPYWKDKEDHLIELPEKVVNGPGSYRFTQVIPLDLSGEFEETPSLHQLRAAAQQYMEENGVGIPEVSITVSFQPLEQTEEYKDLALLEKVLLCDTVTVEYEELGVSARAKCVKTVYDVLLNRYESMELGDAKSSIADTILDQKKEIVALPQSSSFLQAVDNATDWITGAKGGYVHLRKNAQGQPEEILIMDTPDIETAQQVWRWNRNGLGYSSEGYNGPYALAMTQDGAIVADFIKTGIMSADLIRGGVLASQNGQLHFDLDNALLQVFDRDGSNLRAQLSDRGLGFYHNGTELLDINTDDDGNAIFDWRGPKGRISFRRNSTAYPGVEDFITIYPFNMGENKEGGVHTFYLYPYAINMHGSTEEKDENDNKGSISNVKHFSLWGNLTAARKGLNGQSRTAYAVFSMDEEHHTKIDSISIYKGSYLELRYTADQRTVVRYVPISSTIPARSGKVDDLGALSARVAALERRLGIVEEE